MDPELVLLVERLKDVRQCSITAGDDHPALTMLRMAAGYRLKSSYWGDDWEEPRHDQILDLEGLGLVRVERTGPNFNNLRVALTPAGQAWTSDTALPSDRSTAGSSITQFIGQNFGHVAGRDIRNEGFTVEQFVAALEDAVDRVTAPADEREKAKVKLRALFAREHRAGDVVVTAATTTVLQQALDEVLNTISNIASGQQIVGG